MKKAFGGARLPILAAYDANDEGTINLRLMQCPKTGVKVLANAMLKAMSPFAKNTFLVPVVEATTHLTALDQKKLKEVGTCSDCGTSYRTTSKLAPHVEGMRCIVCGGTAMSGHNQLEPNYVDEDKDRNEDSEIGKPNRTKHQIHPQDDEYSEHEDNQIHESEEEKSKSNEEDEWKDAKHQIHPQDDEYEEHEDSQVGISKEEKAKEKKRVLSSAEENASDDEEGVDGINEETPSKEQKQGGEAEESEDEHEQQESDEDALNEDESDEHNSENPEDDENPEVSEDTEGLSEGQGNGNDDMKLTASLIKIAAKKFDRIDVIATSGHDPLYYVMLDRKPVGLIQKTNLSKELASIYSDSKTFINAVEAAISNGMEKAVEEFKIEAIKVEVPVDEAVANHLVESRNELQASFDSKKSELMNVLKQSISIASVAINKEVFKGTENPLKTELIAKLERNGVDQPALLVNAAFEAATGKYIETVLSEAYKLVEKSDESRNEIAKMVEDANYRQPLAASVEKTIVTKKLSESMGNTVTASVEDASIEKGQSVRSVIKLSKYRN
jgi:hypothetical protein